MKTKEAFRITTTDDEIDAAIAQAKVYDQYRPKAVAATYRAEDDRLVLELATGVELAIPRTLLQGLESATPAQIAEVSIEALGSILHWAALDVDHYVPGLIDGVFGTRKWMSELGKRGGSSRSPAKRRASRANGRKGGRAAAQAQLAEALERRIADVIPTPESTAFEIFAKTVEAVNDRHERSLVGGVDMTVRGVDRQPHSIDALVVKEDARYDGPHVFVIGAKTVSVDADAPGENFVMGVRFGEVVVDETFVKGVADDDHERRSGRVR